MRLKGPVSPLIRHSVNQAEMIRSEDRGVSETVGILVMITLTLVVSAIMGLFVLWVEP